MSAAKFYITKDIALYLSRARTNQKKVTKVWSWIPKAMSVSQHLNTVKQPGNKNKENDPNLHNLAAIKSRNCSIMHAFLLYISHNASRPLVNNLASFPWVRVLISTSAFKLSIIDLSSRNSIIIHTRKKRSELRTHHKNLELISKRCGTEI